MTTIADALKQYLTRHDHIADPYTPTVAAMMPFFRSIHGRLSQEYAAFVMGILIEGRTTNEAWDEHTFYQARLGEPTTFPSPPALRDAMIRPKGRPTKVAGKRVNLKHDQLELAHWHGLIMLAQVRAFIDLLKLKDGTYYVTLDGSPSPKYGAKGYEISEAPDELSEAAVMARPIRRSKKVPSNGKAITLVGSDFFNGTSGGHERLHITLHHLETKESLTLYIDPHAKENFVAAVERCLMALETLPVKPAYIVVDKQFSTGRAWEALRTYADQREVLLVAPKIRDARTESFMLRVWDDEMFTHVPNTEVPTWFAYEERSWSKEAQAYRTYGLLVFYEVVADDFQPDNHHGIVVNEGEPGVSPRVAAFPVQVNLAISTPEEALFVYSCIPRRWACEALFGRYKMRFGRSFSRDMGPREQFYYLAFTLLNSYAIWRAIKMRMLDLPDDSAISLSAWIGDVRACMDHPERIGAMPELRRSRRRPRRRPALEILSDSTLEDAATGPSHAEKPAHRPNAARQV